MCCLLSLILVILQSSLCTEAGSDDRKPSAVTSLFIAFKFQSSSGMGSLQALSPLNTNNLNHNDNSLLGLINSHLHWTQQFPSEYELRDVLILNQWACYTVYQTWILSLTKGKISFWLFLRLTMINISGHQHDTKPSIRSCSEIDLLLNISFWPPQAL